MDFNLTPEVLRSGLIFYILIVASLCLRAYAQAWMASRLGDPTPAQTGRLTLNPLPHMDMLGSVVLPLLFIFILQPALAQLNFFLAWAKPVPVNPANFAHPWRGFLYTQLANPIMSLALCLLAALAGAVAMHFDPNLGSIFLSAIFLNACLFVIDFLPVPPLPGGMLLRHFGLLSEEAYWQVSRWGGIALLIAFQIPFVQKLIIVAISLVALPFMLLMHAIGL